MHLTLNKKLIEDLANIRKVPIATTYANTTNYYNRVAHLFTSQYA